MTADLTRFGKELKQLREGKGITQREVVERVPNAYSDERNVRRIEAGERKPARQSVIDILTKALLETDVAQIDLLLGMAGYAALSDSEVECLALKRPISQKMIDTVVPGEPVAEPVSERAKIEWPNARDLMGYLTCLAISGSLAALIASFADALPFWLTLLTATLYASLYTVSILLETAYRDWDRRIQRAALFVFCFILVTSSASLAIVDRYIETGRPDGLWLALLLQLSAAVLQWVIVRPALPGEAIVVARFQTRTSQAAHLKNTAYFLLPVLLFWIPPEHCIVGLRREVASGHTRVVQMILHGGALLAGGIICPQPIWLWAILGLLLAVSLVMGAWLLDNLERSPNLNRYQILCYLRVLLYFSLSVVCLLWYSTSISQIFGAV